jgi:hypothetical protein
MTVEQTKTQLTVVVPIEEEEESDNKMRISKVIKMMQFRGDIRYG